MELYSSRVVSCELYMMYLVFVLNMFNISIAFEEMKYVTLPWVIEFLAAQNA